jgi:hypothetical protein
MNDARSKQIDEAIDRTHLKITKQIIPRVQKSIPDASDKEIKAENKTRPKDKNPHDQRRYYIPIFSPHPGAYQIDLLEQSTARDKTKFPHFFLIAVNVNTRYAYAYPLESKSTADVLAQIKKLANDTQVVSLVADQEGALTSNEIIEYLTAQHISLHLITEQRHTPLAIVDRLIRALRDMNTPTVKTEKTSENPKYRDFTTQRMAKLIKIYNETENSATGHTPQEMKDDPKLERKYIIRKLYARERRQKLTDFDLKEGALVRYILERDPMKKHRYKISPEYYKISGKDGLSYIIMAKDGTTKTVSRWRLFLTPNTTKLKFGASFSNNRGELESIGNYNPRTKKYNVTFNMPDGSKFKDTIPKINLRGSTPQVETPEERAFAQKPEGVQARGQRAL